MGKGKEIVLYGPDGRSSRRVRRGTALEQALRRGGWSDRQGSKSTASGSETAQKARADLERLSAEEWVREWGAVLVASLDETERARSMLADRLDRVAGAVVAALGAVRIVSDAAEGWIKRTGWRPGRPVLEATPERQAAAEDLVRVVVEATIEANRRTEEAFKAGPTSAEIRETTLAGDPVARSRASGILDELVREVPPELPPEEGDRIRRAVSRVRAMLGGSNVPPKPGDGVN